jgi:hypothetical protein
MGCRTSVPHLRVPLVVPAIANCSDACSLRGMKRVVLLAIAAAFVVALAGPAFATESNDDSEGGTGTTDTTVVSEPVFEDSEPVIVIPPSEIEVEVQPWTARYLYPSIVIGTALLLVGLIFGYNHSIRHRYKVVA